MITGSISSAPSFANWPVLDSQNVLGTNHGTACSSCDSTTKQETHCQLACRILLMWEGCQVCCSKMKEDIAGDGSTSWIESFGEGSLFKHVAGATRQSFECPTSNRWGWRQRTQWNQCKLPGCLLCDSYPLFWLCFGRYFYLVDSMFFLMSFLLASAVWTKVSVFFSMPSFTYISITYDCPRWGSFAHRFSGFVSNCLKREKGNLILRQYPVIVISYTMFYPSNLSDQDSCSRDTILQSSYWLDPLDSRS